MDFTSIIINMDLHFLPLVRHEGQDQAELPGLYIAAPPRRPARGRQPDRLAFYLSMEGNAPLPPDQQEQLLKRLAESYYKTPGSVTAALRAVIESLNQYLLDRNLRSASSGRQALALLTLLTLREGRIFLAQCGPVHAYLFSAGGVRHINDPQPARRGLGLGRTAPIYYAQANLSAEDILLVSHQPPAAWNEATFAEIPGQGLESLRRRLLPLAGEDVAAVLVQARPGPGKTFTLRPKPLPVIEGESVSTPLEIPPDPAPVIEEPVVAEPTAEPPPPEEIALPEPVYQEAQEIFEVAPPETAPIAEILPEALPQPKPEPVIEATPPARTAAVYTPPVPIEPAIPSPKPPAEDPQPVRTVPRRRDRRSQAGPLVATIGHAFNNVFGEFSASLGKFLNRMLPGEGLFTLPGSVMAAIAIAVPVVVVTIASVIYFQRGQAGQYQVYYAQAVQAAGAAVAQSEPVMRELAWREVLNKLDAAEGYKTTDEAKALRQQAQAGIDELNIASRLDLQPAITEGLPSRTRVIGIEASETELYLLDESTGSVFRSISTGRGYDIDKTYQCGPGVEGSQGAGSLVDIGQYAKTDGSGTVLLGIDSAGGLLECVPGGPPSFIQLPPPPVGWSATTALAVDIGDVYVLDPPSRQIWIFRRGNFTQQPDLFFDQDIPSLENVIDIAIYQEYLFLLHQDGHLTSCIFSSFGVATTQCTDPAFFQDARPGRQGQPLTSTTPFIQLRSMPQPDPSLYLLDPSTAALYHFSLQRVYQRQLLPLQSAVSRGLAATSFALSPDGRLAFLAFGNEVLYAGMP